MIVSVVTDFEMTFTGDLFKVSWESNDFVFESLNTSKTKQKKLAIVLSKIQVSDPGPTWPS